VASSLNDHRLLLGGHGNPQVRVHPQMVGFESLSHAGSIAKYLLQSQRITTYLRRSVVKKLLHSTRTKHGFLRVKDERSGTEGAGDCGGWEDHTRAGLLHGPRLDWIALPGGPRTAVPVVLVR